MIHVIYNNRVVGARTWCASWAASLADDGQGRTTSRNGVVYICRPSTCPCRDVDRGGGSGHGTKGSLHIRRRTGGCVDDLGVCLSTEESS